MNRTPGLKDFIESFHISNEYLKKAEILRDHFLKMHPDINLRENELNAGLIWSVLSLNQLFEGNVTEKDICNYFLITPSALEEIKEEILQNVSILDKRFLLHKVIKKIEKISPLRNKLIRGSKASLENVFDDTLELHEKGKLDSALYTFLSLFDFIYENKNLFSTEEFISYTFSVLSNIGNIYWEKGNIKRAERAFSNGIKFLNEIFDDIKAIKPDFHDPDDTPIFYIIEDYASIEYALGNTAEAKKYFQILYKIDPHNHMRSDIALQSLDDDLTWDQYVDRIDAYFDEAAASYQEDPDGGSTKPE